MYKAALDVYYKDGLAKAVCMLFKNWTDEQPDGVYYKETKEVKAYESGSFYKRELPCLLNVLQEVEMKNIEVLIVDGYVYLDDSGTYGLGGHLYEALNKTIPVIGLAKTKFYDNTKNVIELKRRNSQNPLYITAIGIEKEAAADCIKNMAGAFRIPTLLKQLDQLTKQQG